MHSEGVYEGFSISNSKFVGNLPFLLYKAEVGFKIVQFDSVSLLGILDPLSFDLVSRFRISDICHVLANTSDW